MLLNHLFESYGAAAGVETIKQLLHAVKDGKDIDLKVGPEMTPITYPEARYLLSFFKANRHLGDGVAKYFGDPNWVIGKLEKRDAIQSPDRLNKFDIERMKDVQKDKVLDLEEINVDHDDERHNKKRMAEEAYKGWEYETDIIDYDDNRKISHTAKKDGKRVDIDWSPYNYMSDEEFKTWVDLDMPTRKDVDSIGPLDAEDLASMMKTKLGTKARLAQEDKMGAIDVDSSIENTPEQWNAWIKTLPQQLAQEFIDERPNPDQMDINDFTKLKPTSNTPISIDVRRLIGQPWVQKLIKQTPKEVVSAINKKYGTNVQPGIVYDQNPDRYFKYAQMPAATAKPSVMANGEIIFGVGRLIAALLRGDKAIKVWNLKESTQEGQLDEILPALGAIAGRAMVGRAASPLVKKVAGAAGSAVGSEIEKKFEEDSDVPPATQDYITKTIAKKIKPGLDPDGEEFEKEAYLYHTSELGKRDLLAKGGNWKAYYDAIKWHYTNANESVEEAKKEDDITKKLDPKTKVALKKAQMKTAGITKGDPVAAMAMGLEKDVKRLDKENDKEEADIAAQDLVDKYHTQELEQLKKMLDSILKK